MQFVFPTLTWGFLLMMVPIVIHLINLLRHRRQSWAAMDFLLESYRKHRRWVWLKQMLLLLSRILIMGLLVAMLAQWVSSARWLSLFGESVTHHYVLLDDSYSMFDMHGKNSAYQRGLNAIQGVLQQAVSQGGNHQVTLIRWSRAQLLQTQRADEATDSPVSADLAADILARSIPQNPSEVLERIQGTSPSSLACNVDEPLRLVVPLVEANTTQSSKLYIVSDFRKKDWQQSSQAVALFESLQSKQVSIDFIDCADPQHNNLTVVELVPEDEIQAAGVPMMMRVQVKNHGSSLARNVQLRVKQLDYGQSQEPLANQASSAASIELPTVMFDQIQPGETATRRFQVLFPTPAYQGVEVTLPEDSIAIDNRASAVVHVQSGQRVLLVDGAADQRHAFFVEAALNPNPNTKTGLLAERVGTEVLREQTEEMLSQYTCIYLMDLPLLDSRTLDRLHRYVDQGGGLFILFGDNASGSIDHFNQEWFAGEHPLAAIRLQKTETLESQNEEGVADVLVEPHPVFQALLGLTQSPFQMVRVSRYLTLQPANEDLPKSDKPSWKSLAKLRNGAPWLIEAYHGQGRVMILLGGLERTWTNWPQDPTFVVSMLKTVGYLGSFRQQQTSHLIGTPVTIAQSSRDVLPEWEVLLPYAPSGNRPMIQQNAKADSEDRWTVTLGEDHEASSTEELRRAIYSPGIVEVWTTLLQGNRQVQNVAYRVAGNEGDLSKPTSSELLESLRPITIRYRTAEDSAFRNATISLAGRSTLLLALLILLLMIEQCLAWSASYHLPKVAPAGGRG